MTELNTVHCADALDFLRGLDAGSVDLILCDPPYGTTDCAWDAVIPLEPMWAAFKHVIKPRGVIALTSAQPFTSLLIMSNVKMFRYEWIWDKVSPTGFLDAPLKPMRVHENILVFSDVLSTNGVHKARSFYSPQMTKGTPYRRPQGKLKPEVYHSVRERSVTENNGTRYPKTILRISNADKTNGLHPTQKPVELFRYIIRTYTRPGELVVDPTCGSGTTAVAARAEGRNFIVNDNSPHYVGVTLDRLRLPFEPRAERPSDLRGLPMFENVSEVAR